MFKKSVGKKRSINHHYLIINPPLFYQFFALCACRKWGFLGMTRQRIFEEFQKHCKNNPSQ